MNSKPQYLAQKMRRGFSLVEMLVALSIFAIITAVFLIRSGTFGEQLLIENLAYDVALSIRRAQSYSIQVRDGEDFIGRYGVYFNTSNPEQYILFLDADADGVYDPPCVGFCPPAPGEEIEIFDLQGGNTIEQICTNVGTGAEDCAEDEIHITFTRPNPDASINTGCTGFCGSNVANTRITLSSPRGEEWTITTYNTGQIVVAPPEPEEEEEEEGGGCPFWGC